MDACARSAAASTAVSAPSPPNAPPRSVSGLLAFGASAPVLGDGSCFFPGDGGGGCSAACFARSSAAFARSAAAAFLLFFPAASSNPSFAFAATLPLLAGVPGAESPCSGDDALLLFPPAFSGLGTGSVLEGFPPSSPPPPPVAGEEGTDCFDGDAFAGVIT